MHTQETPTVHTVDTGDGEPHRRVNLSTAWGLDPDIEVYGWAPRQTPERAATFPNLVGRSTLRVRSGAFELNLKPTAAELRALAALCNTLADDLAKAAMQ